MKSEQLVPENREEEAREVPSPDKKGEQIPPAGRSRKARNLALAGLVAAVVAATVAISLVVDDGDTHAQGPSAFPASDVKAHPDQSPPRELIAAGNVAVSAYYSATAEKRPDGNGVVTYKWSLLNTATGQYKETDWAWLDVAPGMKTAAVLERDLPVRRIGLLNLATDKVERWIEVDKAVGSVQFAPDGKRLVATTYGLSPDGLFKDASYQLNDKMVPGPKPSRSGFYVIDVASGQATFAERPTRKNKHGFSVGGGRQDLMWSRDGALLWEPWNNKARKVFYGVDGKEVPTPKPEADLGFPGAVLSPDGKLATGEFVGENGQIVSEVRDAKSGRRAAVVPGQQLLAWADDDALIAWRCDPAQCDPGKGEFRNQLVLVGLDGKSLTPLSGFRKPELRYEGRWTPIFTAR